MQHSVWWWMSDTATLSCAICQTELCLSGTTSPKRTNYSCHCIVNPSLPYTGFCSAPASHQSMCPVSAPQPPGGKENMMTTGWESQLDTSVLEQSRQKILQILNTGSLKDLKGLQQIGDKKAKLILGWREIHGHFAKVGVITEFGFCGAAPPLFTRALIAFVVFCSWTIL